MSVMRLCHELYYGCFGKTQARRRVLGSGSSLRREDELNQHNPVGLGGGNEAHNKGTPISTTLTGDNLCQPTKSLELIQIKIFILSSCSFGRCHFILNNTGSNRAAIRCLW
jgi:hypothetical protein